jgi:hypothetical protein
LHRTTIPDWLYRSAACSWGENLNWY